MTTAYPDGAGFKDPDTSRIAAEQIAPQLPRLRANCLTTLRLFGDGGATADEVADELDRSILSIRPRFSELLRQGLIRDTGIRRRNQSGCSAKVWRVS